MSENQSGTPRVETTTIYIGRETLRKANRIAASHGITQGAYLATIIRKAVNDDYQDLKSPEGLARVALRGTGPES